MNYVDIEKLAEVFEKAALDQFANEVDEWVTINKENIPIIEKDLSSQFSNRLMRHFRMRGVPGEPPPIPPPANVTVTWFGPPGVELTIGIGGKISETMLNDIILELDNWLKTESRYRENPWMAKPTWKVGAHAGPAVIAPPTPV